MPLLGLATKGDLEKTASCTQIINGVHICSIPKYDNIVEPNDFKFGSVIDSSEKVCLHFDHIPDVVGTSTATAMSAMIGHGDIPDNYLCIDAAKTTQYFKAIVPEEMQPMSKGFLDTFSMDDLRRPNGPPINNPSVGSGTPPFPVSRSRRAVPRNIL